jgi:hypothetical protein
MYTINQDGYLTPIDFAKTYTARKKRVGVSRKYIYDLIERERIQPGSTDIDVLEIAGRVFVRLSKPK